VNDDRRLIEDHLPIEAISAEASREKSVRATTNEWYKAQQLAETYWLYVVWGPLGDSPELVRIHNPVAKLDHAKREIVAARFYEISADAVDQAAENT
jgi:hypothetical protein